MSKDIKISPTYYDRVRAALDSGDFYTFSHLAAKRSNKKDCRKLMIQVANSGDADHCKLILDKRSDVDYGCAIQWAAGMGNLDVLQALIDAGGDVHVNDNNALWWSSVNGHLHVVRYLVSKGVDPKSKPGALRDAAHYKHKDVVDYLSTFVA